VIYAVKLSVEYEGVVLVTAGSEEDAEAKALAIHLEETMLDGRLKVTKKYGWPYEIGTLEHIQKEQAEQ